MPQNDSKDVTRAGLNFLYTEIGRGHPFYLDGIIETLVRTGHASAVSNVSNVFDISRGVSYKAWRLARWLYRSGSSGGSVGKFYQRLRRNNDYNQPSKGTDLLGQSLKAKYGSGSDPLVVAHPLLVAILKDRSNLIYQHGELVVPKEALVAGASKILVPTSEAAEPFTQFGYDQSDVVVTGLCIEPDLVRQAEAAYRARIDRINGQERLTGLFVSSGAEPKPHVVKLARSAISTIKEGHRAIVLARKDGRLSFQIQAASNRFGSAPVIVDSRTPLPAEFDRCLLVEFANRREENSLTAALFSQFDYFVSPAHERVNWAVGLGLPLFALSPFIGPFAPLNHELVTAVGVAETLGDNAAADSFAATLNELRQTGCLTEMAENGWGSRKIDGFARCADFLLNKLARN